MPAMTDFADCIKADTGQPAHPIHLVDAKALDAWLATRPEQSRALLAAQKFRAKPQEMAILPGERDGDWMVVAGVADKAALGPWCLARLAETLPEDAIAWRKDRPVRRCWDGCWGSIGSTATAARMFRWDRANC